MLSVPTTVISWYHTGRAFDSDHNENSESLKVYRDRLLLL